MLLNLLSKLFMGDGYKEVAFETVNTTLDIYLENRHFYFEKL